ncbi:hypothetical protein ACTXKH_04445 [Brachybacterium tyrofermentans]|uniref:hypothetical protein n=1 Tax=Brachybacterium tyrofermentans TaxID=47848 RepID=UPI003F8FF818
MDWITVAVSAGISALVSGSIGLGIASQTTVIQMRAQAREEYRQAIVEQARELQRELLDFQDSNNPQGNREKDVFAAHDLSTAWKFVTAARRLGWFRRWWTMWLLRRVFGKWVVERVRLMKDDSGQSAFVAHVGAQFRNRATGIQSGSLHDAFASPSDSQEVKRALLELRILERL